MEESIFLSIEEARKQKEYYQKLEEEYCKYGHLISMSDGWLKHCISHSVDVREVEIATNLLKGRKKVGILNYLTDNTTSLIIVPEKITKEMLESLLEERPKRNEYFPITPQMDAIIEMIIDKKLK